MFTGVVTGLGLIVEVLPFEPDASDGRKVTVQAPLGYLDDSQLGDSIALNGACMTVTKLDASAGRFTIDISPESLAKTAGLAEPGPVNLEKAVRSSDRLGGHLVSGHVDGVGSVMVLRDVGDDWRELRVLASREIARFLTYKGSIAVNGVSLTVNSVDDLDKSCEFSANLVPHTLENTTLGLLTAGQLVNLEVDLIARYVARLLELETVKH
jgi:riboflavin synthase